MKTTTQIESTSRTPLNTTATRLWRAGAAVLCLASIALVSGCVSVGHTFSYATASNLELGQLTLSDCRSVFGEKPSAVSQQINADGKYDIVRYTYAHANMGSARARTLILEFKDGKLNAYVYISSFAGELISVPVDKINQLKKGESTKADVLNLLGKPNGKALCPSTLDDFKSRCAGNSEIWTWQSIGSLSTFGAAYGGERPTVTTLFVTFDKTGVVNEIQSANASGS
jgi:hypothetical protein